MEIFLVVTVAVAAFFATNIDDIFILIAFFSRKDFSNLSVVLGQYLGVFSLIIISSSAYFFKFIIPPTYIPLFGIIPIGLGVKELRNLKNNKQKTESNNYLPNKDINSKLSCANIFKVATISFINGGDNLGVYIPLFLTMNMLQIVLTDVVFVFMIGLWCMIGYYMISNKIFGHKLMKYGHIILPFVLIAIGIGVIGSGINYHP